MTAFLSHLLRHFLGTVHPGKKSKKSRPFRSLPSSLNTASAYLLPTPTVSFLNSSHRKAVADKMPVDANSVIIRSIVFDISEQDTTTGIRLIGFPDLVPDIRELINLDSGVSGEAIAWERQEGDSHLFTLQFNWFDRSKGPKSWRLMTAVFKYMTERGWALIKTTPWWHSMQFTLFFQLDPLLPKVTIDPHDMFVIRFQSWSKISVRFQSWSNISVMDTSIPVLKCIEEAVSKQWKNRKG